MHVRSYLLACLYVSGVLCEARLRLSFLELFLCIFRKNNLKVVLGNRKRQEALPQLLQAFPLLCVREETQQFIHFLILIIIINFSLNFVDILFYSFKLVTLFKNTV